MRPKEKQKFPVSTKISKFLLVQNAGIKVADSYMARDLVR
jgi:hypothetical protein